MATPTRDDATVESTAHVETTAQSDRIAAERADIDRTIKGATFCSALADTAELHGDVPALSARTETGWATLTWSEVRTRVRDLALGLISLGLEHGQFAVIDMNMICGQVCGTGTTFIFRLTTTGSWKLVGQYVNWSS